MILDRQEFIGFRMPYYNLLLFAGLKQKILSAGMTFERFEKDEMLKFNSREALNEHPELLEEYLEEKGKELSAEDIATLNGVKKRITAEFIVFKLLPEHAIFIDWGKSNVYAVKSLSTPLSVMLPYTPIMIAATILPYRDKIIYDGFFRSYPVNFGKNLSGGFTDIYTNAKKGKSILTTIN